MQIFDNKTALLLTLFYFFVSRTPTFDVDLSISRLLNYILILCICLNSIWQFWTANTSHIFDWGKNKKAHLIC